MPSIHPLLLRCFESAGIDTTSLRSSGSSCITGPSGASWFAKTGHNVSQMRGETAGLRAMAATAPPGLVPLVLGFEVASNGQEAGMVSQYFDLTSGKGATETQRELGRKLAKMHTRPPEGTPGYTGEYGFAVPTHCGVTEQDNTWEDSWEVFYRDRRLGDLVKRIGDGQISKEWDRLKQR
jgi:protein-ribulosamine 3-kinase